MEEEVVVSLYYENLKNHCLTCGMLSHEEESCPELTEGERKQKMNEKASLMRVFDEDSNFYRFDKRPSKAERIIVEKRDSERNERHLKELASSSNRQTPIRNQLDQFNKTEIRDRRPIWNRL